MKICEDCNQEKPFDAAAPARTKASGFYGWYCWDCYIQNTQERAQRKGIERSPEYVALQAQRKALTTKYKEELGAITARLLSLNQMNKVAKAQKTQEKAKVQKVQKASCPRGYVPCSKPYGTQVQEIQDELAMATDPAQRTMLEDKLRVTQSKAAKYGPTAFDYVKKTVGKDKDEA